MPRQAPILLKIKANKNSTLKGHQHQSKLFAQLLFNKFSLVNAQQAQKNRSQSLSERGFTLVEVLIAGVLLTAVLTAVARFSTLAMAGSNHQKDRQAIEASINDNIQLIQQADSQITVNRLLDKSDGFFDTSDLALACGGSTPSSNAASFLMNQVLNGEVSVAPPKLNTTQTNYLLQRNFSIVNFGNTYLLRVEYQFDGPEENVDTEYRIIEISPSFEAGCYQ